MLSRSIDSPRVYYHNIGILLHKRSIQQSEDKKEKRKEKQNIFSLLFLCRKAKLITCMGTRLLMLFLSVRERGYMILPS